MCERRIVTQIRIICKTTFQLCVLPNQQTEETQDKSHTSVKRETNPPEGKGSAAAKGAHLVGEEFSGECEGYGTNAKAKGESKGEKKTDRQVAEGRIFSGKMKVVIETKEDHDQCQGEATSGKLGSSVHPRHDERGEEHSEGECGLKEDGKDGWGKVNSGEDEESEGVVGEHICPD